MISKKSLCNAKDAKSARFSRKACFWPILGAIGCFLESRKAIKEEQVSFVKARHANQDCVKKKTRHANQGNTKEKMIKISESASESVSEYHLHASESESESDIARELDGWYELLHGVLL